MELSNDYLDVRFLKNMPRIEGLHVRLGAAYEPTMHPQFSTIVQGLSDLGMKISLTTNGSLFTDALIEKVKDANFHQITFSFDSVDKDHYEAIRRYANYDRVVERFLRFKKAVMAQSVHYAINMTVLKKNMDDIFKTVQFAQTHRFHSIGLIAAVHRKDGLLEEEDYIYPYLEHYTETVLNVAREVIQNRYDVVVSSSIFAQEKLEQKYPNNAFSNLVFRDKTHLPPHEIDGVQKGHMPGMPVACKSPFTFAEMAFNGDVKLCSRFVIGNILHQTFEEIWFSKTAQYVRATIMSNPNVCYTCDFFKFCLNQAKVDYSDHANQKSAIAQVRIETRPKVLQTFEDYTILQWLDRYYAIDPRHDINALMKLPHMLDAYEGIVSHEDKTMLEQIIQNGRNEHD
jgi:radical SAM protein with 4Fe4S-binding SPASM domain